MAKRSASQEPEAAETPKARRAPKAKQDWSATPYGILLGKSKSIKKAFATKDEAFEHITGLPLKKQMQACLVTVQALKVKVEVSLSAEPGGAPVAPAQASGNSARVAEAIAPVAAPRAATPTAPATANKPKAAPVPPPKAAPAPTASAAKGKRKEAPVEAEDPLFGPGEESDVEVADVLE